MLDDDTEDEEGALDPEDFLDLPRTRTTKQALREQALRRRPPTDDVPNAEQARRRRERRLELMEDKCLEEGDYDKLFKIETIRVMGESRRRRTRDAEENHLLGSAKAKAQASQQQGADLFVCPLRRVCGGRVASSKIICP